MSIVHIYSFTSFLFKLKLLPDLAHVGNSCLERFRIANYHNINTTLEFYKTSQLVFIFVFFMKNPCDEWNKDDEFAISLIELNWSLNGLYKDQIDRSIDLKYNQLSQNVIASM